MREAFNLGDAGSFPNKTAAKSFVQALLNSAPLKSPLLEHEILLALIDRHPRRESKIGSGIRYFEVREHLWRGRFKQRGFWIIRLDGSEIDFSYLVCFRDPSKMDRFDVVEACREAIDESIDSFRLSAQRKCAVTGQYLKSGEGHVDHAEPWPFRRIVEAWLADRSSPPIVKPTDEMVTRFADPMIRSDFRAFHDERAILRMVHKSINLSWRTQAKLAGEL